MHPLQRILRFRRLAEQQARRELERATQLLRAATSACEQQSAMVIEQRASLAQSWVTEQSGNKNKSAKLENYADVPEGGMRGWLIEEAALEFSGWNRSQLEQLCAAEARRIEPMVERYIECRRSLRQTERLVERHTELARVEQERRMQMETDEWFLQQSVLRNRRARITHPF
jgi:flagellar biosynthesis chaperone FliJ